jgi:hypothetical protein
VLLHQLASSLVGTGQGRAWAQLAWHTLQQAAARLDARRQARAEAAYQALLHAPPRDPTARR